MRNISPQIGEIAPPRLAAHRDATELALGGIVVEAQAAVVVEPCQGTTLVMGIAERRPEQAALTADALVFDVGRGEEGVGVGDADGPRGAT